MPRHSRNSNVRSFTTYYEKKKNQQGAQGIVYGSDSVKPFDCCTLCLHHCITPMCCEKGHLYCKECIYKYLLLRKKEYEEQMEAYRQAVLKETQDMESSASSSLNVICDDLEKQQSVHGSEVKNIFATSTETKEEKKFKEMKAVVEKLSCKYDDRTDEEKSLKMNFWIPENTPEYKDKAKMPVKEIQCPCGEHELTLKKLTELHFTEIDEGEEKVFACPACMKKFQYQASVTIKACGHVLCSECFKKFVGSSKQCYVCQSSVMKKKDFIPLISGGTGFSSHNKVDVKVYKPIENCIVC